MTLNKTCAVVAAAVLTVGLAPLAARQGQTQQTPPPAQQPAHPPITQSQELTKTFTIEAIDYKTRAVTLKDKDGNVETVTAGPQIQRFNELKVGDTVTFKYVESVLYSIRPSGPSSTKSMESSTVREQGPKPGGTVHQKLTASVTVTAIDAGTPSVTVKTDDGNTMSFKIKDPKNIEHVKVGDRVDITYTRALAVAVQ